jgi:predicted HTH transcriptional regulator
MSGFCNSLLGKDIYDIKENDLINFFKNEQEETNTLEFKSGDVEIQKLCKEICAFLNTEGGLIIIGTPTEKKKNIGKNTYNICQGKLTSSRFSDKDWLYKKIYSRITPVPTNLKIQEIKNERSKYFVIEVNQSSNPPHQLDAEGRYYIRIEREAKPAPHGIVEALFNRRQKPQPRVNYYTDNITDYKQKIDISIFNDSNVTAENISGYLEVYGLRNIIINDPSKENIIKYTNNIYKIRLPLINYLIKGLENNTSIVVEHNKNPLKKGLNLY